MAGDIRFDGRVAVITGAGNGLGRDYALEIARRGGAVLVNDLGGSGAGVGASHNAADAVVDEIRAAGGKAAANYDSVATRAGGEAIIAAAVEAFGKVDIVISNAGFLRNARFEDIDDDRLDSLIDVHLKGAFYVAQPAYRIMRQNGYGRFVFTGSASAMFGHAWQANYAAAKGGLMGLSHIVAIEGSAYGIKSNLLLPTAQSRLMAEMDDGFMEIPDFARSVQEADYSAVQDRLLPAFNTPLALYLASERCQATHGIFSANGGRYAQVLIQTTQGWISPAGSEAPSVEDVAEQFDRICNDATLHRPMTVYDEFNAVAAAARERDAAAAPAA